MDIFTDKKIIIICGHYGVGKTNFSVNLALYLKQKYSKIYTLADLDIVNPYFRASDSRKFLANEGIDMIVPEFANTNVDIPSIPPQIYSLFIPEKNAIIDVGGDDVGATALGMLAEKITEKGYEMYFVINKYRIQIEENDSLMNMARGIEKKSSLKLTGIINNSNLGNMTDFDCVKSTEKYAKTASGTLEIPLIATTLTENLYVNLSETEKKGYFPIRDYIKKYYI